MPKKDLKAKHCKAVKQARLALLRMLLSFADVMVSAWQMGGGGLAAVEPHFARYSICGLGIFLLLNLRNVVVPASAAYHNQIGTDAAAASAITGYYFGVVGASMGSSTLSIEHFINAIAICDTWSL